MHPAWPADKVERWPIARLIPYARNARTHTPEQIKQIAASMREWGWTMPVLADEQGGIIAGHCRISAAEMNGYAEVPVMVAEGWSDAKKRAYVLADNKLALNAGWDDELLVGELADLKAADFDLETLGFSPQELNGLLRGGPQEGEDEIPEPGPAVTERGDVWELGAHRLVCGDATSSEDIGLVLGADSENAIVTDPPYGVSIDYGVFEDSRENVAKLVNKIMPRLLRAPCAVLTSGNPQMWFYPQPAWVMAWIHPAATGACSWGFSGVNPILAYGKDPYLAEGLGRRADFIVMASDREGVEGHPVPKPIKVWKWLVERVSPTCDRIILDPFGGSGTTLIACETLGHNARLIEIEPRYCDVIVKRWENFTGKTARRHRHGA